MIKPSILNARKVPVLLVLALFGPLLLLSGCGKDSDDGNVENTVELPSDGVPFSLYCEDIGLYTETCVLEDPNNPYARSAVTEDGKFILDADAPNFTSKFYVWATALASGAGNPGENQFYVALNLHRMWAANKSEITRVQALRAYQSYLDNYFGSVTFPEEPPDSNNFVTRSLNEWTGQMLFDPTDPGNYWNSERLFSPNPDTNKAEANLLVGEWGYFYDQDIGIFAPAP